MVDPGVSPNVIRNTVGPAVQLTSLIPGHLGAAQSVGLSLASTVQLPGRRPRFEAGQLAAQQTVSQSAIVLEFQQPFFRAKSVYDALVSLIGSGTLCTIVTSLRTYDSMALETMETPREGGQWDAKTGKGSIRVMIEAVAVRVVSTQTVQTVTIAPKRKAVVKGAQNPEPATPAQKDSALYTLTHGGTLWSPSSAAAVSP